MADDAAGHGRGTAGHAGSLEYHRSLLDDPLRIVSYERALRALVEPGQIVLDLGCGTGVLALLAARLGAARVHAVESMPVIGLARRLAQENGLADRIVFHAADARDLPAVEPVDLVVSDFMGRFLVDDEMLPAVRAAAAWLKPGGVFCPRRVELGLAPVGDIHLRAVDLFDEPLLGLDLRAALPHALHYAYHAQLAAEALLADPSSYYEFRPTEPAAACDRELEFVIARPGRLQAVAGWFEAELAPDVTLHTGPGWETHWGQYLFPVPPVDVRPGDHLRLRLWLDPLPTGSVWRWTYRLRRAGSLLLEGSLHTNQRLETPQPVALAAETSADAPQPGPGR